MPKFMIWRIAYIQCKSRMTGEEAIRARQPGRQRVQVSWADLGDGASSRLDVAGRNAHLQCHSPYDSLLFPARSPTCCLQSLHVQGIVQHWYTATSSVDTP